LIHIVLLFGGLWILLNAPAIAQEQQQVPRQETGSRQQVTPFRPKVDDQSQQTKAPPQPETQPQDEKAGETR
jgi:hypothetical protein